MMMGTKARYAVMAMVELARRDAHVPITLAQLAEAQEITVPYLEQIFSKLKRQKLVTSVRGPGGGYTLALPADQIAIAQIVQAADESLEMTRCNKKGEHGCMSSQTRCLTHELWEGLTQEIHHYLGAITLADVCQKRIKSRTKSAPASKHG